jgi:pilus assembly protein Flp/PilA
MMKLLKKLWKDEEGQGLVEYGLIIVLIAIAVITTLGLVGGQLDTVFNSILTALTPDAAA